jgi:hypothetical protein
VWNPKGGLGFVSLPTPALDEARGGMGLGLSQAPLTLPTPSQGLVGSRVEVRLGAVHSRFGWWQGIGPGPGYQRSCLGPHLA